MPAQVCGRRGSRSAADGTGRPDSLGPRPGATSELQGLAGQPPRVLSHARLRGRGPRAALPRAPGGGWRVRRRGPGSQSATAPGDLQHFNLKFPSFREPLRIEKPVLSPYPALLRYLPAWHPQPNESLSRNPGLWGGGRSPGAIQIAKGGREDPDKARHRLRCR